MHDDQTFHEKTTEIYVWASPTIDNKSTEGLGYPRFDSQLAATSLLVLRSVKDTPGRSKVRRRTKRR